MDSLFPFNIEILFRIDIDGHFFLPGLTYVVNSVVKKTVDKNVDLGRSYSGIMNHYVIEIDNRNYLVPSVAAAIVPNLRDPEKAYRMKYWIDKSQGEYVRDYVILAYQMHGVSIAAKQGVDQADYSNQKILEQLYGADTQIAPGQPVKIIIPDYKEIESNNIANSIPANLILNIVSARFYRGETLVYSIGISKEPETPVEVFVSSNMTELVLSKQSFVFTPENYDILQEMIVEINSPEPLDADKVGEILHEVSWPSESVRVEKISILLKADR